MKTLFISTDLDIDLVTQLEEAGFKVYAQSLLQIDPVDFELPNNKADWIFFYSKNGIKYFYQKARFVPDVKYGVMGDASAQLFESLTQRVPDYIAKGSSLQINQELNNLLAGSVVCAPQAADSLNFLENIESIKYLHSLVVYKSTKLKSFDLPAFSNLAFTSPMNAQAYFEHSTYQNETVYAVGATTAKAIEELISVQAIYPESPSLKALIECIIGYN